MSPSSGVLGLEEPAVHDFGVDDFLGRIWLRTLSRLFRALFALVGVWANEKPPASRKVFVDTGDRCVSMFSVVVGFEGVGVFSGEPFAGSAGGLGGDEEVWRHWG